MSPGGGSGLLSVGHGPNAEEDALSAHGDEHAAALPSGLSKPAQRALAQAGYTRLGQLSAVSASELLQLHGMGPKAIAVLESALAEAGLSLRRD